VGLIADGIHSHPSSLELALRAKGWNRIALVSDMMAAAGMEAGTYELAGRSVMLQGDAVRLDDGTLAGSVLTMDQAARNMVRWTSASAQIALHMASAVPSRLLGLGTIGEIRVGFDADLVLLDAQLGVRATMIGGAWAYKRESAWHSRFSLDFGDNRHVPQIRTNRRRSLRTDQHPCAAISGCPQSRWDSSSCCLLTPSCRLVPHGSRARKLPVTSPWAGQL
jgi:hypothetical protein